MRSGEPALSEAEGNLLFPVLQMNLRNVREGRPSMRAPLFQPGKKK